MAELNVRFDIRLTPSTLRWVLVALMLCLSAGDVGSESVTLNTFYPAPSGIYQYMVTTNSTFLARDASSVNVGYTTASGTRGLWVANALGVNTQTQSNGNALNVVGTSYLGGNVGINTATPSTNLTVAGSAGLVDIGASNWVDPGATGASVVADNNVYKAMMIVGNNIAGNSGLGREVKVWDFLNVQGQLNTTGSAGHGNVTNPLATLDVGGNGVVIARQTGCTETNYSIGTTNCPAGRYATMQSGFMSQYAALGNLNGIDTGTGSQVFIYNGSMFCCPLPSTMPAGW